MPTTTPITPQTLPEGFTNAFGDAYWATVSDEEKAQICTAVRIFGADKLADLLIEADPEVELSKEEIAGLLRRWCP